MKDTYPTRKKDKYSITTRIDKVSFQKPKMINRHQFQHYNENGFLIIKNFFNKKTIELAKKECYNLFENNEGCYVNKEPKSEKVRSILSVHNNENISPLVNKKILNMAESILGDKVYLHQSRINYKDGKDSSGWSWHSDFETWHSQDGMPRMRCLTAMIPVDDNTVDNGCINFIPKSHLSYISCPKVNNSSAEDEFSNQLEGVPDADSINTIKEKYNVDMFRAECSPGDLVLFDCNTLHYSDVNKTENKRTNLYLVLNSLENKLIKPFNNEEHRPVEMGYYTKNLKPQK